MPHSQSFSNPEIAHTGETFDRDGHRDFASIAFSHVFLQLLTIMHLPQA